MIKIIAVGKIKEKSLQNMIDEYLKRLSGFTKVKVIEVADEVIPANNSQANDQKAMNVEGKRLLEQIKAKEFVILLDLHGEMIDSISLAQKLADLQTYQNSNWSFVVGGSLGLSQEIIERADFRWKLSDLTFPHQLTRLILVEQLYRIYKINNNETYHK